ncbi:MAG: HAD-IA family hydrolase, partial [Actinobacteria bacterium]|nr:HAD-IA family hydrolase [Actinomycetota bacterium]
TDAVADQFRGLFDIVAVTKGNSAGAVLVGRDLAFDFERLTVASDSIRAGATFIAFNRDVTMPVDGGVEPGTGSILAALEAASGKQAVVVGKPEAPMMQRAQQKLEGHKVLMVGDRVESDILGAERNGWDSALVLTGVAARTDEFDPKPTYIYESLLDLVKG